MKKKGLSEVLATLFLIALTIIAISVVWVVVNNTVKGQLKTSSCFNVQGQVTLNSEFTCYNERTNQLVFSINVGNLDNVNDILVSITQDGQSTTFNINGDNPAALEYLNGTKPGVMQIPAKNSGLTYIYNLTSSITAFPDSIEIAPIVNGQQCQSATPITQFDSCSTLVTP